MPVAVFVKEKLMFDMTNRELEAKTDRLDERIRELVQQMYERRSEDLEAFNAYHCHLERLEAAVRQLQAKLGLPQLTAED